jgi:putative ABC transport system permease protein
MTSAPLGFDPNRMLTFTIQLPNAKYRSADARMRAYDEITTKLRALPGVVGVANVSELPTAISNSNGLFIQDAPWGPNEPVPFILTARASDDYFRTLEIPLEQGRTFTTTDGIDAPPVIVINEAMARRYWPKGNAVGAQIHIGPPDPKEPWITVIGIVGNVRNDPMHLGPEPMMILPLRQSVVADNFAIRTSGDPVALVNTVRRTLTAIDPMIPMYHVSTMDQVLGETFAPRRLPVVLMATFGGLALLLASVGVYAMFASMATAREREFGVRVALGSSRGAIVGLVLRQGGAWMIVGLAVGAIGVVLAARFVRTQLFGVAQFDPIAIGIAVLTLLACAGVALLVPVVRASRVDPINVLR